MALGYKCIQIVGSEPKGQAVLTYFSPHAVLKVNSAYNFIFFLHRKFYSLPFLQESGVGKSSILQRFVYNTFNPNAESTIGQVCIHTSLEILECQELLVYLFSSVFNNI